MNRRNVLVGMGGLVAGGGALIGTGAFDTVEAERTVSIETAGDASAFLGLAPADRPDDTDEAPDGNAYVNDPGDGIIQINLDGNNEGAQGLNQNADTTFRELVEVTNQGTQTVETINLEMFTPDGENTGADNDVGDQTFWYPIDEVDGGGQALMGNNDDLLAQGVTDSLTPGESIRFGLEVRLTEDDLHGDGDGDLPDGDYTLSITAESEA